MRGIHLGNCLAFIQQACWHIWHACNYYYCHPHDGVLCQRGHLVSRDLDFWRNSLWLVAPLISDTQPHHSIGIQGIWGTGWFRLQAYLEIVLLSENMRLGCLFWHLFSTHSRVLQLRGGRNSEISVFTWKYSVPRLNLSLKQTSVPKITCEEL